MQQKGTKVYVYGLLDEEGQVYYIGKSTSPKARLYSHCSNGHTTTRTCKILDYYYDTESYWVQFYSEQNPDLVNSQTLIHTEDHEIGDILTVSTLTKVSIKNTKTGEVFESIAEFVRKCEDSLEYYQAQAILDNPAHKLYGKYPIVRNI